jgi:hypothetical protein
MTKVRQLKLMKLATQMHRKSNTPTADNGFLFSISCEHQNNHSTRHFGINIHSDEGSNGRITTLKRRRAELTENVKVLQLELK